MIRCIYSPFTEIYFHLAAEEYLLKQGNEDIFMLWQDTPSVVIGKHQRLRSEVDQEWAEREQVHIARRFSGGGAVYHDLGNVNLTFIETTPRLPEFAVVTTTWASKNSSSSPRLTMTRSTRFVVWTFVS